MKAFSDDVGTRLGGAIRAHRHSLGLTLVDVAARAGLSHPFLSQLERGLTRPSMRSLTAIASALDTSAQALMAAAEAPNTPVVEPVSVVRHETETPTVSSPGGEVRTLVRGERSMLPVEYTGAPATFKEYFRHDGEEFVYVVAGLVEVDVDGDLHVVAAGDSIYYAGGLPHRWRGLGPDQVRLVVVQQNTDSPFLASPPPAEDANPSETRASGTRSAGARTSGTRSAETRRPGPARPGPGSPPGAPAPA